MGDLNPHLIHGPLGPPKSSTQMTSRSVQPFLQGSLVWQTDRQTTLLGLTIDHIYVRSTTTQSKNETQYNHKSKKLLTVTTTKYHKSSCLLWCFQTHSQNWMDPIMQHMVIKQYYEYQFLSLTWKYLCAAIVAALRILSNAPKNKVLGRKCGNCRT